MSIEIGSGTVYMVVRNDDLTAGAKLPSMTLTFGPKRRTLKWRGRRFNVPTSRVTRIGFVPRLTITL